MFSGTILPADEPNFQAPSSFNSKDRYVETSRWNLRSFVFPTTLAGKVDRVTKQTRASLKTPHKKTWSESLSKWRLARFRSGSTSQETALYETNTRYSSEFLQLLIFLLATAPINSKHSIKNMVVYSQVSQFMSYCSGAPIFQCGRIPSC